MVIYIFISTVLFYSFLTFRESYLKKKNSKKILYTLMVPVILYIYLYFTTVQSNQSNQSNQPNQSISVIGTEIMTDEYPYISSN